MEIDNKASSLSNNKSELQPPRVGSFGHQLKQARVSKGLSLEDVATELYILKRHLEAIENEDFEALPQMAFARGFVVNYAKYLKLDPEQIGESFNHAYPENLQKKSINDIESPLRPMGTLQRKGGRSWRINPLLVLGLIGLIILAVFIIRTVSNAQSATKNDDDPSNVVDQLTDSEQTAGAAIDPNDTVNNVGSALGVGSENANLDFNLKGNANIEVVDGDGNSLVSGAKPSGRFNVSGNPPFKIKMDNASNVTLSLNGQEIDLTSFTQGNTADFTLSP